jgi:hypothetical protein
MKISTPLPTPADYEQVHEHAPARPMRRMLGLALRVMVVLLALLVGYKLTRVALHGWNAYQAAAAVAALRADGDIDGADLVQAQQAAHVAAQAAAGVESELRFFAPALRSLGPLPWIGPTLAAVPNMLAAGREGALIGQEVLALVAAQAGTEGDTQIPALLTTAMAADPQAFLAVEKRAATVERLLAAVPAAELVPPLATLMAQAQSAAKLLAAGLEMTPVLPDLLGFSRPQTYLVLIQNNQELRATGGFITAVGAITLNQGLPAELDFVDSYEIARNDVDHPWAPAPLKQYMGIELIFLRDANWSPDFPTSALLAQSLYAQDAGVQVDGVVSVDLRAVELLVGALAPLQVPGAEEPVTAENLITQIQRFWDNPPDTGEASDESKAWWARRKDFMPIMAKAALDRIKGGGFNPLALVAAGERALTERAIQVWTPDPERGELLAAQGWDGRLRPKPGADFLALVDTNMGYNKVDAVLERSVRYEVSWPDGPDAPAQAVVTVNYRHPIQADDIVCQVESAYGPGYADMMKRCYFNFVRLYVPGGSELIALDGVTEDSVVSQAGERGTQMFGGYFVLEPGHQHNVTFTYRLPAGLTDPDYRLVVQRQSGSGPLPLQVRAGAASLNTTLVDGRMTWTPE